MAQPQIIQGEDRELIVGLIDSTQQIAFDLTGATEIEVLLPSTTTGVAVSFTLTGSEVAVVDALKGKISLTMSDAKTALLKTGDLLMEIVIDKGAPPGGDRRISQITNSIKVLKKQY